MATAERDLAEADAESKEDGSLDDTFRFRLYKHEKIALKRAARAEDRLPGNFTRVILREWLKQHGYV